MFDVTALGEILIDFTEDTKPNNLGSRLFLCEDCKRNLIDILLPF